MAPWCHVQSAKVVRRPPPLLEVRTPTAIAIWGIRKIQSYFHDVRPFHKWLNVKVWKLASACRIFWPANKCHNSWSAAWWTAEPREWVSMPCWREHRSKGSPNYTATQSLTHPVKFWRSSIKTAQQTKSEISRIVKLGFWKNIIIWTWWNPEFWEFDFESCRPQQSSGVELTFDSGCCRRCWRTTLPKGIPSRNDSRFPWSLQTIWRSIAQKVPCLEGNVSMQTQTQIQHFHSMRPYVGDQHNF